MRAIDSSRIQMKHDRVPAVRALSSERRMRPRALLIIFGVTLLLGPANSRELQVMGTAGYLSEWQISANLSEDTTNTGGELSGPVVMKHTGLCNVKDPVEKSGEMKAKISGWGPFHRIDLEMSFASAQCVYRGRFANGTNGFMDCSDARAVPLTLSIR